MGAVVTATLIPAWFKAALRDFLGTWRQPVTEHVPRAYWDTLSDCEQGDIEAAGLELRRSAGGEWPPSASTWHQAAVHLSRERRLRDTLHLSREQFWREECRECSDTGWQIHTCRAASRCERPMCSEVGDAHEHTFATVCPCRPTNRTYQRARERERTSKRADAGESKQRRSGGGGWTKASEAR